MTPSRPPPPDGEPAPRPARSFFPVPLFNPRWKPAIGFAILILTLILMPRGIFGRRKARI